MLVSIPIIVFDKIYVKEPSQLKRLNCEMLKRLNCEMMFRE